MNILRYQLTIRGFMVNSFAKEFGTALSEMAPLVQKVKETNEE
jgi:NADPH-dependent curcumin reductase CurA